MVSHLKYILFYQNATDNALKCNDTTSTYFIKKNTSYTTQNMPHKPEKIRDDGLSFSNYEGQL